jgi:hypothetical protein
MTEAAKVPHDLKHTFGPDNSMEPQGPGPSGSNVILRPIFGIQYPRRTVGQGVAPQFVCGKGHVSYGFAQLSAARVHFPSSFGTCSIGCIVRMPVVCLSSRPVPWQLRSWVPFWFFPSRRAYTWACGSLGFASFCGPCSTGSCQDVISHAQVLDLFRHRGCRSLFNSR